MTVYSSLVLYLMPTANTKSLCWVFFRAAQRLTHSLVSWVGLGVDRRQKCPSWIIETRCWPKGPGEWWRKNVPHQRKVLWTVIMWSLQGGNLELTLLFFPASTCGSVYYNSSIWRFFFFSFFPLQFKKRQRLCPSILFKVIMFVIMTVIYICDFRILIFKMFNVRIYKSDSKCNFKPYTWCLIYVLVFFGPQYFFFCYVILVSSPNISQLHLICFIV